MSSRQHKPFGLFLASLIVVAFTLGLLWLVLWLAKQVLELLGWL